MKKKKMWFAGFCGFVIIIFWGVIQLSLSYAGGPGDKIQQLTLTAYDYTDRLIVKHRNPSFVPTAESNSDKTRFMINERLTALSSLAGVMLTHFRFMSGDGHVLKLPQQMTQAEASAIALKLAADPDVEYAEPDRRMFPMLTPNDPRYADQWHYKAPASEIGGANLPGAWDKTTGSGNIVVAVIDTGFVTHADLDASRIVPGYNFISDALIAGNGVGRSADPSDLGDWITQAENTSGPFVNCPVTNSTWHGTHVTGTIGASTQNSVGVAGVNWTSKILPVRVLGKCGGYLSDIIDGMRWAAGLSVNGVPNNSNPAKVMNLSLGGRGACDTATQTAVNDVIAAGATIVVAAGNSNANTENYVPASCNGVISVAATGRSGGRAYYSNYGTIVKIAAPGGSVPYNNDPGVLSTLNSGTTTPVASPGGDTYRYYQGTSMATPHVTGIVSLMLSINPALTPARILTAIQSSARTFPTSTGSDCTTSTCGSGIIDATAAVNYVSASNSILYSDFTGYGIYRYNGSTWTGLHNISPARMAATGTDLYVAFSIYGLYQYIGSAWTRLHHLCPTSMAACGTNLYVTFSGYNGIFKWNGSVWSQVSAIYNPTIMVCGGADLYAAITDYGLYKYNGSTWTGLHYLTPVKLTAAGTDLYAAFTNYGIFKYNSSGWSGPWNGLNNTLMPTSMAACGADLYAAFTGDNGIFKWNGSAWSQVSTIYNPTLMVCGDTDLYAAITGYGTYKYSSSAWTSLHTLVPASMAAAGGN